MNNVTPRQAWLVVFAIGALFWLVVAGFLWDVY
ncbi:YmiA family putative membrane protein [Enterobacter pseudoroggenkampii]|nr:YmiA family putative membrane protein [Enterobacter pseudoroggenkampii]MCX8289089.1 YmiA family putative membrane protein [Enterobacter pseudoroggenkampii]